jgi:flagellar biosynthetic protein FliO
MTISCAIVAPNYMTEYYSVMFAFLVIIIIAWFSTRWLLKGRFNQTGKNMQVIERMYLSSDKFLMIVLVHDTYYLLSQDKSGIRLIDKLDDFKPQEHIQETKFSDILEKLKAGNKDK